MKRNDWILLLAVFLYSFLFYKQSLGINFLIFNTAIVFLLLVRDKQLIKNKTWLSVAAGALVSSFFIFMYGSPLAFVANLFSLAVLSTISVNVKNSFLTGIFLSVCSTGSSCVFMFIDWYERRKKVSSEKYSRPFYVKLLLILVPLFIALLFFLMYQSANPLFYNFTKDINLDWISLPWVFFTLGGIVLLYGFFYNRRIPGISDADENAAKTLSAATDWNKKFFGRLMRLDTENLSGIILLFMLNALLLILNVLDVNYLWFDGKLPEGIKHSEFVHESVGMLITSIIIAIFIIMFYFRGAINFYENNKWLRYLSYFWIFQNAFMIFSTAFRNDMYIDEFGLSYKRIGVYVYLLLTLIGLAITFWKIIRKKTNWYLFRANAMWQYYLLVIGCTINWDVVIADYNIGKLLREGKHLDKYYLLDLSFKNIPALFSLPDSVASKDDFKIRDWYFSSRNVYFTDFKSGLHKKTYKFLEEMKNREWKSVCAEKNRVFDELVAMKDSITKLRMDNNYVSTLIPLSIFSSLHQLEFSGNRLDSISELSMFPVLEKLNLNSNLLDTIDKFPLLSNLKELSLSNNNIANLAPLKNAPNITSLDISNNNLRDISSIPELKNLTYLNLGSDYLRDYSPLKKFPKLESLDLSSSLNTPLDSFPEIPALKWLNISNNKLGTGNFSVFEKIMKFENLTYLDLSNNPLQNLYVITDKYKQASNIGNWNYLTEAAKPMYAHLEYLNASSCSLRYIHALAGYKTLKCLTITSNTIDDITPLSGMSELTELYAGFNSIQKLSVLKNLIHLEKLSLPNNAIVNADDLAALQNLVTLDLSNNDIREGGFLSNIKFLKYLYLDGNEIKDIAVISGLSGLEEINLRGCPVSDFSPLLKLKKLKRITVGEISKEQFEALKKNFPEAEINTSPDYTMIETTNEYNHR